MYVTFVLLVTAVAVLQVVNCGPVRVQAPATLEKLVDFEQRVRNVPVVHQRRKTDFLRTENAGFSLSTSTCLMYVSDGDLSKASSGELHSVRLHGEDQYRTQMGIIIDFWYPYYGQNMSGPIVGYEGFVQWYNSSGDAMSRVKEGGIGYNHVTFELSHSLPGMMGYLYDYLVYWRDA